MQHQKQLIAYTDNLAIIAYTEKELIKAIEILDREV